MHGLGQINRTENKAFTQGLTKVLVVIGHQPQPETRYNPKPHEDRPHPGCAYSGISSLRREATDPAIHYCGRTCQQPCQPHPEGLAWLPMVLYRRGAFAL